MLGASTVGFISSRFPAERWISFISGATFVTIALHRQPALKIKQFLIG
jgi:hypothetical protein